MRTSSMRPSKNPPALLPYAPMRQLLELPIETDTARDATSTPSM
jgi:hypothetical protein